MGPLELVGLTPLMERGQGRPEVVVALIDGPVVADHADLARAMIREPPAATKGRCARRDTAACTHGTFVAGILSARRGSGAPSICPGCTLLLRPILAEAAEPEGRIPGATAGQLAAAVVDAVDAGARVVNLSLALVQSSPADERDLAEALNYAAHHGVLAVAAAGNEGVVGSSAITRHPWVVAVAACDLRGAPLRESNLGGSIGRHGLSAPGEDVASLATDGGLRTLRGTSVAAPFVTGAVALAWSEFPSASAAEVKRAFTRLGGPRTTVVPPLLDA